jgi:hypothetical protein
MSERVDVTVLAADHLHLRSGGAPMSERSERVDVTVLAAAYLHLRSEVRR